MAHSRLAASGDYDHTYLLSTSLLPGMALIGTNRLLKPLEQI